MHGQNATKRPFLSPRMNPHQSGLFNKVPAQPFPALLRLN